MKVEINHLTKVIQGNVVLDDINACFSCASGENGGRIYGIQGINGSGKTMLKLSEKRNEVSFAAADMAHSADIHSVDFAFADMPQHLSVSGAQQPTAMLVGAAAHNGASISMSL